MWKTLQASVASFSSQANSSFSSGTLMNFLLKSEGNCLAWNTFSQRRGITKLTTFNVVDNSKLGQKTRRSKKPYLIGFYRKRKTADIGDVIRVAVQGKTSKALVVATRKPKRHGIPRYDNNNIILLDDNNAPLGTRIKGPIPATLRKQRAKFSKVIALAARFV